MYKHSPVVKLSWLENFFVHSVGHVTGSVGPDCHTLMVLANIWLFLFASPGVPLCAGKKHTSPLLKVYFRFWNVELLRVTYFVKWRILCTQPDLTLFFLIFTYLWGKSHWSFRNPIFDCITLKKSNVMNDNYSRQNVLMYVRMSYSSMYLCTYELL